MEFEFKVDKLISKVDALIMKDLQFKKDCNKNIKLLNERIENYNKDVSSYNEWLVAKAESQLEGVSDLKLMLDLTELKQKYREEEGFFGSKSVPYDHRTLKNSKDIQETVSYMEGISLERDESFLPYSMRLIGISSRVNHAIRRFKYHTMCYNLRGNELYISVDLYVYLEARMNLVKEKTLGLVKELQSIKDKLSLAKKYDVGNITLGEGDLETLTFFENHVYRDDTLCWEDMYKNEKVLKFIEENTNGK